MVSFSKISVAAYALTTAYAINLAADDETVKEIELAVYVNDIYSNMMQYLNFRSTHKDQPYPDSVQQAVMARMFGSPESKWLGQLTTIPYATVSMMMTGVPWYSTRLLPALEKSLAARDITITYPQSAITHETVSSTISSKTTPAAPTTSSTTTSAAPTTSSTTTSAAPTTSSTTTSAAPTASSTTTSAAPTTSSTTTSAAPTSSVVPTTSTTAATTSAPVAWTTLPVEDPMVQSMELAVYVKDINANMQQYLNFQQANPGQPHPPAIAQAVMHAMMGQPESEFMTLLTGIDPATVQMMLSGVPWYSTRLEQALDATFRARHVVVKTAAPGESSAAASSVVSSTAASSAAASSAAASSVVSSAPVSSVVASSAAASSVVSSAPVSSVAVSSVSAAPTERNTTYGVSTQWTTATSLYHNTTTVNSCPSESAKTATTTTGKTDTLTSTVCDEVCHSKKSEEAKRTATATEVNTSTVTATVCDEVCHSKKSEEAKKSATATKVNTSTVTETVCDEECRSRKSEEAHKTLTETTTTCTNSAESINANGKTETKSGKGESNGKAATTAAETTTATGQAGTTTTGTGTKENAAQKTTSKGEKGSSTAIKVENGSTITTLAGPSGVKEQTESAHSSSTKSSNAPNVHVQTANDASRGVVGASVGLMAMVALLL
ncbi:SRP1/TIP1 family protein KNAG_0B06980 [Huiozyma naganishii CBS 8797]|uniref:Uncharacterized protein n=1 Tax=Huiozyma naganishii (strain ATCC MYA-139 / BCRC 22969 / CBS 8797 / KCTC 17520 / NBRC 10181 / NCYC 3082 / Yp74L-3) TaxID=1071383 RepID=J7RVY3_HUIN7|nr:hypothetical protein KNAG_0B06980 [Kazachstania naganishii CBS 8797]CCK69122.1 hypothetical protein KNAG_0B06980 [Kazachstania naganishii CBS 8797]